MYTKAFNNMVYRGNTRSNGDLIGGGSERPWTSQLTKAEYDISLSSQRLENVFRDVNRDSLQVGNGPHVPSPIKMIRRLTALEIAIGKLGQDCEMISEKRRNIVQSVIADQNQNIAKTIQILRMKRDTLGDENWRDLSEELQIQLDLLNPSSR
mmetsp:Transcript_23521/g.26384  ORF Transcript_23521/g.26384 Transcript_23521/m.26384 type:complete len:153 (-) Transcript_23521:325-783(-)